MTILGPYLSNAQPPNTANMLANIIEMEKIPEVTQCHYTTGNYSVFIKLFTRDNEHLKSILTDKLQSIQGIARTETFISLEEGFNRSIPILVDD